MQIELDWTSSLTPDGLARELLAVPEAVNRALGERGEVIGAEIVSSAKRVVPVDTGKLKADIDYEAREGSEGVVTVYIGNDVEYAIFVEFGTRYMAAQPYIRPAIRENKSTIESEIEAAITDVLNDVG